MEKKPKQKQCLGGDKTKASLTIENRTMVHAS